jgi:hypothetical protein
MIFNISPIILDAVNLIRQKEQSYGDNILLGATLVILPLIKPELNITRPLNRKLESE